MKTHAEIIEMLGGYRAIAELIGVDHRLTSNWAKRGIPAKYWPDIEATAMARSRGVTAQLLRRLSLLRREKLRMTLPPAVAAGKGRSRRRMTV